MFQQRVFQIILIRLYTYLDHKNPEICTGCPQKKLALGNKLFMASGGLFWIYLEFYWPEPLQVHCWVTPECTS